MTEQQQRRPKGARDLDSFPDLWEAMWSLPGCLPESDPFVSLDESVAREYLADAIERHLDDCAEAAARTDWPKGWQGIPDDIRGGDLDSVSLGEYVYTLSKRKPVDMIEARRIAVAEVNGSAFEDVEECLYGGHAFEVNGTEWRCLEDDEADEAAFEYCADNLWAFNASFLEDYIPEGVEADTIKLLQEKCEDANQALTKLVGDRISTLVEDAIWLDGRGHFLASYDGEEREARGFYLYRIN